MMIKVTCIFGGLVCVTDRERRINNGAHELHARELPEEPTEQSTLNLLATSKRQSVGVRGLVPLLCG